MVPIETAYMRLPIVVRHSTVSKILQDFGLITPPLFHPILRVFPLHQIGVVGVNLSRYLKLFGCEIIVEVFHPV